MAEKSRLALLAEIAGERRDAAGKRLGRALAALREAEARLALLARYRDEYERRLANSGKAGMTAQDLRNFREFLDRLGEAIAQQRAEIEGLERGVESARGGWMSERARMQSFDVLAKRAATAQATSEERRLQKLLDEFSGRRALAGP